MELTYEDRTVQDAWITQADAGVSFSESPDDKTTAWGFGPPTGVKEQLTVGDHVKIEHKGGRFGPITGIFLVKEGRWIYRHSDLELNLLHKHMLAENKERRLSYALKNLNELIERENALPYWIRRRLDKFHESGGEDFITDGWDYELVIAELAVLYAESNGEDTDKIWEYAKEQGTSGNQHDMAKALAKIKGKDLYGSVSGLSPITGDAYYEKGDS